MPINRELITAGSIVLLSLLSGAAIAADDPKSSLSFFITSVGTGNGANLGGLAGADAHCQKLAAAAGAGNRTWRAYLSTTASGSTAAVNARDRIGKGPWRNAKGVVVATDVDNLHSDGNQLSKENSLNEKGEAVSGRGDTPNRHDILTGSEADGKASSREGDSTCKNWTSNAEDGSALVGHHDRQGGGPAPTSWNAAHPSRGCGQKNLQATGGDGLFYCFATN